MGSSGCHLPELRPRKVSIRYRRHRGHGLPWPVRAKGIFLRTASARRYPRIPNDIKMVSWSLVAKSVRLPSEGSFRGSSRTGQPRGRQARFPDSLQDCHESQMEDLVFLCTAQANAGSSHVSELALHGVAPGILGAWELTVRPRQGKPLDQPDPSGPFKRVSRRVAAWVVSGRRPTRA